MELPPIKLKVNVQKPEFEGGPQSQHEGEPISPHNEDINNLNSGLLEIAQQNKDLRDRIEHLESKNRGVVSKEPVLVFGAIATLINAALVYFGIEALDTEILVTLIVGIYGAALAGTRAKVSPVK